MRSFSCTRPKSRRLSRRRQRPRISAKRAVPGEAGSAKTGARSDKTQGAWTIQVRIFVPYGGGDQRLRFYFLSPAVATRFAAGLSPPALELGARNDKFRRVRQGAGVAMRDNFF